VERKGRGGEGAERGASTTTPHRASTKVNPALMTLTSFSGCTSFRFCQCDFSNSVKCPCNVTHDSVTLIVTFLIIIIIIIITVEAPRTVPCGTPLITG